MARRAQRRGAPDKPLDAVVCDWTHDGPARGRGRADTQIVLMTALRASGDRWRRLSHLLTDLTRAVEHAARLDVATGIRPRLYGTPEQWALDVRLVTLEGRLRREVNRLTVERLDADLRAKRTARDERAAFHLDAEAARLQALAVLVEAPPCP